MKNCPNCGNALNDDAVFCNNCGAQFPGMQYQPAYNMYDHTAEFDPKDVSENKVFCMVIYLMGQIGVVIAMLAQSSSPYVKFHVRQALKITVVEILLAISCIIVVIPILGWLLFIAALVMMFVMFVVRMICFVSICNSKAIEAPIVRSIEFLR